MNRIRTSVIVLTALCATVLVTASECGPPGGGKETKFTLSVTSGGTWAEDQPASIGVGIASTINEPYKTCDFNIISGSTTVRTLSGVPVSGSGRSFSATVGLPPGALKAGSYTMDAWCYFDGGRWYSRTAVGLTVVGASASPSPTASGTASPSPTTASSSASPSTPASTSPTSGPAPAPSSSTQAPAPAPAPTQAPSAPSADPSTPPGPAPAPSGAAS